MNCVELKPCPFCGSKRIGKEHMDVISIKWITCRKCGALSGLKASIAEAIEAWNLRVKSKAREPVTLKPCPFCGSEHFAKKGRAHVWVGCRECGASTGLKDSSAAATEAWNLRI